MPVPEQIERMGTHTHTVYTTINKMQTKVVLTMVTSHMQKIFKIV